MTVTRQDFEDAIAAYWDARQLQSDQSALKARLKAAAEAAVQAAIETAVGTDKSGSVRSGKHFDPIANLLAKFFLDAGYPPESIRVTRSQRLELPGYYRPQKQWDLVVVHGGVLVAAFELKALGGPSFGNNYNNRVEEALGSAIDLRRAALAELYPKEKPWLGYFFIMEDGKGSRTPVKIERGALPADSIWQGTSYQDRFGIFCERLVAEQLYDAACYVTSSAANPAPIELVEGLDWRHFSAAINARLTYLRDLGIPG